jgi:hypothetical protein
VERIANLKYCYFLDKGTCPYALTNEALLHEGKEWAEGSGSIDPYFLVLGASSR